jgi:hypothetical protein
MLNIKGFSPDLFSFSGHQADPDLVDGTAPITWKDLFTVYGLFNEPDDGNHYRYPGRININTAGLEVIQALLPLEMAEFAQDMLDYRAQKSEDEKTFLNPLDKGWYRRVIGLSAKEQENFERMIRYDSQIFRVTATVRLNRAHICCGNSRKNPVSGSAGSFRWKGCDRWAAVSWCWISPLMASPPWYGKKNSPDSCRRVRFPWPVKSCLIRCRKASHGTGPPWMRQRKKPICLPAGKRW